MQSQAKVNGGGPSISKAASTLRSTGPKLTLWSYIRAQISTSTQDEVQVAKHERVYNFLQVPPKLEQVFKASAGFLTDWFLAYIYWIFDLLGWVFIQFYNLAFTDCCFNYFPIIIQKRSRPPIPFFGHEVFKGLLLTLVCGLVMLIDASRLYHTIRGQSVVKLYVIFNVLEILDKLCCSIGLDIMDSFFSKPPTGTTALLLPRPIHFIILVAYVFVHTLVLFFQMITLNVSINSFNNALLTLLVSNQFVEIKSAVFKKFERENLFQLSCSDILERFQLTLYILIIGFRNFVEISASGCNWKQIMWSLVAPLMLILLSEVIVDWLKHAFITKFNHIHPEVYLRFIDALAKDFDSGSSENSTLADQSPIVSRRIGFSSFPLTCLLIRILMQIALVTNFCWWKSPCLIIMVVLVLFSVKISLGMLLISYTRSRSDQCEYRSLRTEDPSKLNWAAKSTSADFENKSQGQPGPIKAAGHR